MKEACDEKSPATRGCDKEEPTEPPRGGCMVIVYGGYSRIRDYLDSLKPALYSYNSMIRPTGYYLKPVHKVYYRTTDGRSKVYEYYGRYWWRIKGQGSRRRLIYVGREKPPSLPDPPVTGLEGVKLIVEGKDVVLDCASYKRIEHILAGLHVEILE
ncbi:hypothetical protein [Aeropyrum pernix]|nr:hypothetical protein [Aeropyrum pernix]